MRKRVNKVKDKHKFTLTARKSRDVNLTPISFRQGPKILQKYEKNCVL